jgi:cellulose biosynthesis protein BcsQ
MLCTRLPLYRIPRLSFQPCTGYTVQPLYSLSVFLLPPYPVYPYNLLSEVPSSASSHLPFSRYSVNPSPVIQVAFVNRKGGAGKTTVATLAAVGLLDSGFIVGVKDYDDQGSFRTSLFGSGVKEDPAMLPNCDVVVADTPGRFGAGFDEAVEKSHLVVVVSGVQPLEITELPRTYDRIRSLQGAAKSVVVFNKVRSNTLFGRQNFSVLVETFCGGAIPTAPFVIPYKEAYGRLPAILWEEQRGRALSYVLERDIHTSALRLASFLGTSIARVLKKETA